MPNTNWLDRTIGLVSPKQGLKRARARAVTALIERRYDGAKVGRRSDGWITSSNDANTEIATDLIRLRNRSRDLVRNNAYAAKAVFALTANLVGTGIIPRARSTHEHGAVQADQLWARWSQQLDMDGNADFSGIQTLVARTLVESGECLVRFLPRSAAEGLAVPLQLQVLEPDHLDASRDGATSHGGWIQQGIEFDRLGLRVAYWLFPHHPGAFSHTHGMNISIRVEHHDVLHIFDRQRPGQIRGVTWFAPAIVKLRDLDDYDDAELMRKKIEACFVAFVMGSDDADPLGDVDSDEAPVERFEPGMVEYLPPGKDIKFGQPNSTAGYSDYMRVQLHAVASAVGLTYELLTGDLSQVNYSSIRAGLIEFRRRIKQLQTQLLIPALCQPVWQRFIQTAQAAGTLPPGDYWAQWTPPRFEAVDPIKDVQADILAVRAGLMTLKEAIARQGYDPSLVLKEISATFEELDELGIVLDTDPRKSTRTGADKPFDTEDPSNASSTPNKTGEPNKPSNASDVEKEYD